MTVPRTRIKMCGMTRAEDIAVAAKLGVDAVGFIFHPASPRCVTIAQAQVLLQTVPLFVSPVAVLVNPDKDLVKQILQTLPIAWLQFHGDESPAFCEQFGFPYVKAIPATGRDAIETALRSYHQASALLLDTPNLGKRGGSGVAFDWGIIPPQPSLPLILAGGLTVSNVRQAIAACHPVAVDVCSGVEQSPGLKDHEKMQAFVQEVDGFGG